MPVSVSGYYGWYKREPSQHSREDAALAAKVELAFENNRRVYGSPRIHAELHAQGIPCGQKRVARLMRELGISAQRPKHRTITTHSEKGVPVAANLLQQDFHADRPNQKWTTDTTYIWTREGWLYLAVVLDVFSRMVARLVYGSYSGCDSGAPGLTHGNSSSLDSKRSSCITRIVVAPLPVPAIWRWYRRMAWYRA